MCIRDRNGTDAQSSESWPRKYIFHDDGSGDQLRNTHTDGNDAGVHGVFQDMFYQNGFLRQAADIGIEHIVLFHVFQHIVADQADIGGNVA